MEFCLKQDVGERLYEKATKSSAEWNIISGSIAG